MRKTDQGEYYNVDTIALKAATDIVNLTPSQHPTQHKARIQCIIAEALTRPETDQAERAEPDVAALIKERDEAIEARNVALNNPRSVFVQMAQLANKHAAEWRERAEKAEAALADADDTPAWEALKQCKEKLKLALSTPVPAQAVEATPEVKALIAALRPFMPIETHDTPDYAELRFGKHETQAMTVRPKEWQALNDAFAALAPNGASS